MQICFLNLVKSCKLYMLICTYVQTRQPEKMKLVRNISLKFLTHVPCNWILAYQYSQFYFCIYLVISLFSM